MTEIKLGLGEPPVPVYLFVKLNKDEDGVYCWYTRDNDTNFPVRQRALTGYLKDIKMKLQDYKGKRSVKVDFKFQADRVYVVRTGAETTFLRGLVLDLVSLTSLEEPICLACEPGDEAVYARVYTAYGERSAAEWDKDVQLFPLIQTLQERLGSEAQTMEQLNRDFEAQRARR